MRLLVVGCEGQVARSLRDAASDESDLVFKSIGRPDVDLLRRGSVTAAISEFGPDIVVNAAAYTAVDRAEDEADAAFAINRDGAGEVAAAAAGQGVPVMHFSTDYVFDGTKPGFYEERDTPNPKNIYGLSKLEGERAVMSANTQHIILRTSWVYAPFGTNFVRTIWRKLVAGESLRVVDDQTGCPSYAPDLARATIKLVRHVARTGWRSEYSGILHIAGPDALTWYCFARLIESRGLFGTAVSKEVMPISSSEFSFRAVRPTNSRLSSKRLESVFDIRLPALQTSLDDCLARIAQEQGRSS